MVGEKEGEKHTHTKRNKAGKFFFFLSQDSRSVAVIIFAKTVVVLIVLW